ncbi:MAG: hypothetical protein EOM40_04495 [Clostridia bacterium]|nr:hypothetical protein [Clostridia bacterium]NCC43445.1 hypothetical protein [Clostridia bacterium]
MGIISLEQADHLLWLGRYSERVYTTIRLYSTGFDEMIDSDPGAYLDICNKLEIPDIYGDKDTFIKMYAFDSENFNSIMSNMKRAYDNAIVLREEIGTETFSYIQVALYELQKAEKSVHPLINMQNVIDYIVAFWGMADDSIENEDERNIIKLGKRIERVDLYCRMGVDPKKLSRELRRLEHRVDSIGIPYDAQTFEYIKEEAKKDSMDYHRLLVLVDGLLG